MSRLIDSKAVSLKEKQLGGAQYGGQLEPVKLYSSDF